MFSRKNSDLFFNFMTISKQIYFMVNEVNNLPWNRIKLNKPKSCFLGKLKSRSFLSFPPLDRKKKKRAKAIKNRGRIQRGLVMAIYMTWTRSGGKPVMMEPPVMGNLWWDWDLSGTACFPTAVQMGCIALSKSVARPNFATSPVLPPCRLWFNSVGDRWESCWWRGVFQMESRRWWGTCDGLRVEEICGVLIFGV